MALANGSSGNPSHASGPRHEVSRQRWAPRARSNTIMAIALQVDPISRRSDFGELASTDGTPFRALLRRYRLAAGLSQEALADRANLSVRAISALERGERQTP